MNTVLKAITPEGPQEKTEGKIISLVDQKPIRTEDTKAIDSKTVLDCLEQEFSFVLEGNESFVTKNSNGFYFYTKKGRKMNKKPYEYAIPHFHGYAVIGKNNKEYLIDKYLNIISEDLQFDRYGIAFVEINGKTLIISEVYSKISQPLPTLLIRPSKDRKRFTVKKRTHGNWHILNEKLDFINKVSFAFATEFSSDKTAVVSENDQEYYFVDWFLKPLFKQKYSLPPINFENGVAIVKRNKFNRNFYINKQGVIFFGREFQEAEKPVNGFAIARSEEKEFRLNFKHKTIVELQSNNSGFKKEPITTALTTTVSRNAIHFTQFQAQAPAKKNNPKTTGFVQKITNRLDAMADEILR